jgi:hypothetical protein
MIPSPKSSHHAPTARQRTGPGPPLEPVIGENLRPLQAAKTGSGQVASTARACQRTVVEHRLSRGLPILHRPTHTIIRLGRDLDIATAPHVV